MARRWTGDGEAAELEAVVVEGVLARKLEWNPRDQEMLSQHANADGLLLVDP